MKVFTKAFAVWAVMIFIILPVVAQTRGITAEDYFAFRFLNDIQLSPDGATIAFVVGSIDQKENRRYNALWAVPADGSREPSLLTTSLQSSNTPRWRPDGKAIAFLSARPIPGESTGLVPKIQVWILPLSGGEPSRVTNLQNGVTSFVWSPDGSRLLCVSKSGPSDTAKSPSDVRHYKHASYKFNDTGWFDDKRSHIWIVDVTSGITKQVTSGDDWNDTDPQWSPDGTKIAFVSDRTGKEFDEGRNKDIWTIDVTGRSLTKISRSEEPDSSPRWSPDGKTIAFLSASERRAHPKIWLAPSQGGTAPRLAAEGLDLIPTDLRWAESGRALYFETGVKGTSHLFRVDVETRRASQVTSGDRTVRLVNISDRSGRLVYSINDPMHMDDIYVADLKAQNERQLTHLNAALFKGLQLTPVERVVFKGADGWDVDGFLMRPLGWEAGKKYPMVLSIHGGPAGMFGFDWYHEHQVYAARGWAVFFTNPRGSTGYGEKFDRGVQREWGGRDYVDVMNGVDAVLAKNPWIDADRLGVTGGSYGGFLTNWILGHTTRFKAAVTLRSIATFISDEGTRDGPYGHSEDFGGDLFEQFETYWDRSPLKYAKNVKTPTLVMHSDMDFRVPIEQGEQWFRALQHYGVPSELVLFPRENHNLTRTGEPVHLVESLKWQVYWFDRYLERNTAAVPPDAAPLRGNN
ncbi:MAG TPA: S9 family peptidase [Terriglobia bacterium]|nr:S9 family peptidase [Terriglobia bacterium]